MSTVPTIPPYDQYPDMDTGGTGFGSLLSILSLGLIKDPPKVVLPTQDQTEASIALGITNILAQQGMSAPVDQIKASVGYNLNAYDAWDQVLSTNANASAIVTEISQKVIQDLMNSGLVTVAPGSPGAGTVVTSSGTVAAQPGSTLSLSPTMLAVGGGGLLLLMLLMRRGHHDSNRR